MGKCSEDRDARMVARFEFQTIPKKISCVMSVLAGGQPSGMQCGYGRHFCCICDLREHDDAMHVLIRCPALEYVRQLYFSKIVSNMPPAMRGSFLLLDDKSKLIFMLSGFKCKYTPEWIHIYEMVAQWVFKMYEKRKELYDHINGNII